MRRTQRTAGRFTRPDYQRGLGRRFARFEFRDASFQRGELYLGPLEEFFVDLEILACGEVEAVEERDHERVQVLFEVLDGRSAQGLANALAEFVQRISFGHAGQRTEIWTNVASRQACTYFGQRVDTDAPIWCLPVIDMHCAVVTH